MNTYKVKKLVAAVGLGLAMIGGSASAGVTIFPNSITSFQDDDIDFVFDAQGNLKTTGDLSVGDHLISVLEVQETFDPVNGVGPFAIAPDELTGIADIEILAINDSTPGDGIADSIIFSGGVDFWLGTGATVDLTIVPPNCASFADCQTRASNGSLWASLTSNLWVASNAGTDIDQVKSEGAATTVAFFNFGLNFDSFPGLPAGLQIVKQDCLPGAGVSLADMCGSGNVLGGAGLVNGAIARSDFDFQIQTTQVPEPVSMALFGIGLLGLGAIRRRG